MRWLKLLPLGLLVLLAVSVPFAKQWRQSGTGGIEGFVTDQANIPVGQASIQVCNTMRGGCAGALSELNGYYRIDGLIGGRYTLWAEAKRHSSEWMPVIIVEDGQITRQDIQLRREIPTITVQPAAAQ